MRLSDWEQRKLDAESGLQMDADESRRRKLPCKNMGFAEVDGDGSCLRCGAAQGESCREIRKITGE
jgi:hypothetical protein